ncbi:hypothetical protein Poli38472_013652 [Pythium oligandrum]|uniref:Uncharacterized protein n=1 Tax=Pythium oligandrum TaxID=41045 RepID=A0A8K1CDR7_PYTOL|nr:hypothetical protein Poli38472_013652 [Pythium oligandrum]|eukprot:TMW61189.1 hypothetical protein Poli38472_013652 [Pythium oligandrum]
MHMHTASMVSPKLEGKTSFVDLAVLALVGLKETRQNYCIKWTEDVSGGEAFALVDNGQTIVFKTGGIFFITLDVLHSSTSKGFQLELLQNDETVSWVTGCQTSHGVQSFLPLTRTIKSGDTLKVLYIGNNRTNTGNTMSIIQLRKE